MWLIKDKRTNRLYKSKYGLENDIIHNLCSYEFIKEGILTKDEIIKEANVRCLDKWSFIDVLGQCDGRRKGIKTCPYFTWLIVK